MILEIKTIINSFWFLLPAAFANMAPEIFKWFPLLESPLSVRLFGSNKTWRGVIFGILMAIIITLIQQAIYLKFPQLYIIDYSKLNGFLLGFLFGFGAVGGDLIKSFIKRRIGIAPGEPWLIADQVNWSIGALIAVSFYIFPGFELAITTIILFFFLHILINHLAYWLGIRATRW